jgi:hypothetical protein
MDLFRYGVRFGTQGQTLHREFRNYKYKSSLKIRCLQDINFLNIVCYSNALKVNRTAYVLVLETMSLTRGITRGIYGDPENCEVAESFH